MKLEFGIKKNLEYEADYWDPTIGGLCCSVVLEF